MLLLLLLSRFSRVRLCGPMDSSPPGSPIPGILQATTLEWVAIAFSNWSATSLKSLTFLISPSFCYFLKTQTLKLKSKLFDSSPLSLQDKIHTP